MTKYIVYFNDQIEVEAADEAEAEFNALQELCAEQIEEIEENEVYI